MRHDLIECRTAETAVEPLAVWPVRGIAPIGRGIGKRRIGPRIPAVDVDVIEIDHALSRHRRDRIEARDVARFRPVEGVAQNLAMPRLHQESRKPREK